MGEDIGARIVEVYPAAVGPYPQVALGIAHETKHRGLAQTVVTTQGNGAILLDGGTLHGYGAVADAAYPDGLATVVRQSGERTARQVQMPVRGNIT